MCSVPEAIMKVVRWLEAVAELPEADCYRRLAWAVKDKIVEDSGPFRERPANQQKSSLPCAASG